MERERNLRTDHRIKVWITYAIALAALIWVFHDLDWASLIEQVQRLSLSWLLIIIGLDVLSFYVQGVRWQILLQPIGRLSYLKTTQAIYVGLFTSEVLPLRAGEIIRGVLVARWLKRKFRDVLPSMAMERIFDAFWFSSAMIITALLIKVPPQIRVATNIMLTIAVVGIAGFVWIVRRTHFAESMPDTELPPKTLVGKLRFAFYEARLELKQIGLGRRFWTAAFISGLLHVVQALYFLGLLQACGIHLPLLASIAVFLVVNLGIAIPNAPANVGTFQLFSVLGLTFFGVDKSSAAAFSLVAWTILTIPVLLIGVIATLQAGLSLTNFHQNLRQVAVSETAVERIG
jgi:glycosyltransferase 2 family protein